jgi:hypothetical protein
MAVVMTILLLRYSIMMTTANGSTHLQRVNVLLQFPRLQLASILQVLQLLRLAGTCLPNIIVL